MHHVVFVFLLLLFCYFMQHTMKTVIQYRYCDKYANTSSVSCRNMKSENYGHIFSIGSKDSLVKLQKACTHVITRT